MHFDHHQFFVQLIHSAVLHTEQSAVSCWQRCPQSYLVS